MNINMNRHLASKFFLSLCLAGASVAHGFEPAVATVKIYSGLCQGDKNLFRGSGLVFTYQNEPFVLTSEHVLLHQSEASGQPICSRIWNPELGELSVNLIQADWGIGLALLKVNTGVGAKLSEFPTLEELASANIKTESTGLTYGFPYMSESLFIGKEGRILNAASDRAFIPLLSKVVEITTSHGEFGMSGGPVFSADESQFEGVLSHQYMQIVPGGASEVSEYKGKVIAKADHVFAIPQSMVVPWLTKMLSRSEMTAPTFVRDASLQFADEGDVVFSTGLQFKFYQETSSSAAVGGMDGHGIGGAHFKNGGSSGHGIGGSDGRLGDGNTVEISLDMQNHLAHWGFAGREAWVQSIKAQLLRNHRITIPFFIEKNKFAGKAPQRISVTSLSQFVSLLRTDNLQPVTMIMNGTSKDRDDREQDVIALKTNGAWLMQAVVGFRAVVPPQNITSRQFLADLNLLAELLSTGDWPLVDKAWIQSLENRQDALKELINLQFDDSVELIQHLKQIETQLTKVLI